MKLHWPDPRRLIARPRETQDLRCPLCFDALEALEDVGCSDCSVRVHADCREEFGGCPSGCERGHGPKVRAEAQERLYAWQAQARERLERIQATRWAQRRPTGRRRPRAPRDPINPEVIGILIVLACLGAMVLSHLRW